MIPPPAERRALAAELALSCGVAFGVAAALAFWDSRFHVVPTSAGWWRGVSDPPGLARVLAAAITGALLSAGLWRRPARVRIPLLALAIAAAPLVPVWTGRALPLLAFQGPVLVLVCGAALSLSLSRVIAVGDPGRVPAVWLFLAAFAFDAALATRIPGAAGPQGDEPQYLAMAESLRSDHDLDLADEFAGRAYSSFYSGRLTPHVSPASPPGHVYSVHGPGLPLLVVPAYAIGGLFGVQIFLCGLAALAGVLVYRVVLDATNDRRAAVLAWALLCFTPPLPVYAVSVYPELPAALGTAVFLWTARGTPRWPAALTAAAVAGALPWFHSKFLAVGALGLALTLMRPCAGRVRGAALGLYAGLLAGLLALFHRLYGVASFSAAFGPPDVALSRLPWGVSAMFLDRQFGLLPFSPVWLLALPGAVLLLRTQTGDALRALLLLAVPLVVGGAFVTWWGGSCPPARFLLPAMPALALLAAPAARARKGVATVLGAAGLLLLGIAADAPRVLHNRLDGESLLLRNLNPSFDLSSFLPSFLERGPATVVLAVTILAAAALAWTGRRGAVAGLVGWLAVAAAVRTRPLVDPQLAVEDVLDQWEPANWWGPTGPPNLRALSLPLELQKGPWTLGPGDGRNSRRTTLYPGDYRVELRARPLEPAMALDVTLVAGGMVLARARLTEAQPTVVWPLLLPAGARQLGIRAEGVVGRGVLEEARVAPQALIARGRRGAFPAPVFALEDRHRAGVGAVRTTVVDRSAPEEGGFRLDGADGQFVVDGPSGASALLRVRRVRPETGDAVEWGSQRVALPSSPEATLVLPLSAGDPLGRAAAVPVRVHAAHGAWVSVAEAGPPGAATGAP